MTLDDILHAKGTLVHTITSTATLDDVALIVDRKRAQIARTLGLLSLPALSARLSVRPWMDGVEITGRFKAVVEQVPRRLSEAAAQSSDAAIAREVAAAKAQKDQQQAVLTAAKQALKVFMLVETL